MRARWRIRGLVAAVLVVGVLGGAGQAPAQPKDPTRDVFLQTIGLLAGQGLVTGHESLEGIAVRYEKKLLPKDKALEALAAAKRYVDLTLSVFTGRLMAQLAGEEKKDLTLLIGFYEAQRNAIAALIEFVRTGNAKHREAFVEQQGRVAAIIRQISLGGARP